MFGAGAIAGTVVGLCLIIASKVYGKKDFSFNELTSEKYDSGAVEKELDASISEIKSEEIKPEIKLKDRNIKGYFKRGLKVILEDGKPKPGKDPSGFLLLSNSIKHAIKSKINLNA